MAGFVESSDTCKVALALLLFTGLVHIISFGAPFWTTRPDGHAGLWEGCNDDFCYERWNQWVAGWIKASQTFMTLSVIFLSGSTFLLFLYMFHKQFDQDRRLIVVSAVLSFMAGLSTLMAAAVWAGFTHYGTGEMLSWPFMFAVISAVTSIVAGFFLARELGAPAR